MWTRDCASVSLCSRRESLTHQTVISRQVICFPVSYSLCQSVGWEGDVCRPYSFARLCVHHLHATAFSTAMCIGVNTFRLEPQQITQKILSHAGKHHMTSSQYMYCPRPHLLRQGGTKILFRALLSKLHVRCSRIQVNG